MDLRKEFSGLPEVKGFKDTSVAFEKVKRGADMGTAAGDMSLIYGFMRLQDPGSSVKEGEYASAEKARGVPSEVIALYNKAKDGQLLSPEQRKDFLNAANGLYAAQSAPYADAVNRYRGQAEKWGLSPDDIVPAFGGQEQTQPAQTAPAQMLGKQKMVQRADGLFYPEK